MNDARRPAPAPLTFSPALTSSLPLAVPIAASTSTQPNAQATVSMPFIKRHVTRRLKAAKQECDKELTALTHAITNFFEERIREGENIREPGSDNTSVDDSDREARRRPRERDRPRPRPSSRLQEQEFDLEDLSSDEEGYEAGPESTRPSRHDSETSSPTSLRRQHTFPRDGSSRTQPHLPGETSPLRPNNSSDPHMAAPLLPPSTITSRRLSRSINLPPRPIRSTTSSRSTSRSRSPLPSTRNPDASLSRTSSANRRSSRILIDDPIDPFMLVLHSIIALCADVIDMPLSSLTSSPHACAELVEKVQKIGQTWDDHPEWHGRAWYVQLLLTVAGLSRVVEWWEAEKQFWNLDDEEMTSGNTLGEEEKGIPLAFVLKPSSDHESYSPTPPDDSADQYRERIGRNEQKTLGLILDGGAADQEPTESSTVPSRQETETTGPEMTPEQEAELLQEEVARAHNLNIVMELSMDGDRLIWVNDAWRTVVGTEPEDQPGCSLSSCLAPSDMDIFRQASLKLQEDDSSTVEAQFKLRVEPNATDPLYRHMEGKGMLMYDRIDGTATHSMWVIKPLSDPEPQTPPNEESGYDIEGDINRPRTARHHLSTAEILCRICEFQIPQYYFEKHSETCHETHKLEADIRECNDSIAELRSTIRDLTLAIEKSGSTPPEYRGLPILVGGSPAKTGPLQLFRPPFSGAAKLQRMGVKKLQKRLLEQLDDILQVAAEVSIPTLKEDESKEPIERQRLLSPSSERKISTVRTWNKPLAEDPALAKLVDDVDHLMKAKLDSVVRMQNTVRYAEKVRQEWEQKVQDILDASADEKEEEALSQMEKLEFADDSSTRSEYGFAGDESEGHVTPDPTPLAPSPVILAAKEASPPTVVPGTYYGRSLTPSSTSSPLALATPILPASPLREPLTPADLGATVKRNLTTKSMHGVGKEPKVTITPPLTPNMGTTSLHRRHSSAVHKQNLLSGSSSPHVPPSAKTTPTSIKDFEIIKPISKGAFGSVFLAKKKVTGDYYAIKVLKKSDMIAKNQITNVKAERMILMKQGESPFVVKLLWTFQSRDNLYLVMEYLNGGDCAALIKAVGSLPEEWTRNYIAEVTLGLEYLHQRGVTHRDLKPDNLLIDQQGHLKLTDFGLSRIGLLGRQARDANGSVPGTRFNSRPPSMDSVYLTSPLFTPDAQLSSYFGLRTHSTPQLVAQPTMPLTLHDDIDSSGSEGLSGTFNLKRPIHLSESPLQSFASELATDLRSHISPGSAGSSEQKVVGTPDYLAPETILGISKDDRMVDWWALGVITYEFLFGFPPFHAESPDKVFENIISGRIDWHDDYTDFSEDAVSFVKALLQADPSRRLGAGGPTEVKRHPFLAGVDWDSVSSQEAQFIPQVTDPESTDYFDPRGAIPQLFQDDDPEVPTTLQPTDRVDKEQGLAPQPVPIAPRDSINSPSSDDFGAFSFKNLGILKQANDDVIRKLKIEQPVQHTLTESTAVRRRSLSQRIRKPPSVLTGQDPRHTPINPPTNPPSPSTSASSVASSPSYSSIGPSTPGSFGGQPVGHSRRPSEYGALERFKLNHLEGDRRSTVPSRLRTASISSCADPGSGSSSDQWSSSVSRPSHWNASSESSNDSSAQRRSSGASSLDRAVTILIAEDNPISAKILETILTRMGCRCIVVSDGSEAVSVANGDIRFDVIMLDLNMPIIDGEAAAQYIRSTNSKNTHTPIVSVSAYTSIDAPAPGDLFSASLTKPVQKVNLLAVMQNLGFKIATVTLTTKSTGVKLMPR